MLVTVMCPNLQCRATLSVPEKVRGKKVRCPECSITFLVPASPGTRQPKPASAHKPTPADGKEKAKQSERD